MEGVQAKSATMKMVLAAAALIVTVVMGVEVRCSEESLEEDEASISTEEEAEAERGLLLFEVAVVVVVVLDASVWESACMECSGVLLPRELEPSLREEEEATAAIVATSALVARLELLPVGELSRFVREAVVVVVVVVVLEVVAKS